MLFCAATRPVLTLRLMQPATLLKNYAILSMPTSVLISTDGKVMQVDRGFLDAERTQREQDIRQALHRHNKPKARADDVESNVRSPIVLKRAVGVGSLQQPGCC